ncbi:MAG: hypothetical protein JHC30_06010 [Caldisericum sp.]|jgi:hypothetical protein|nr:hypothetical protein [Caldisericum sp.]
MNLEKLPSQLIGNIGLFYVCYELSRKGWNCLPTTRNAKGVDIIIYDLNGERKFTIQVKALSRRNPVPFGSKLEIMADFVIVCTEVFTDKPEVYILTPDDVKKNIHKGVKDSKTSYWLQPQGYLKFREAWGKIGKGY